MALNAKWQLDGGDGLMKVLVFTGLSHPVVVHPTIHGEPLLTAQAFYYLEELESVAHLRYETGQKELSTEETEYLIDNYLFEYSKTDPESRMTLKVSRGKYWDNDPSEMYVGFDQGHTEALALDSLNDPTVKQVRPVDPEDAVDLSDWRIAHAYTEPAFQAYVQCLEQVLTKKVFAMVLPRPEHDGYVGKLRVVKCDRGLIDCFQAEALDNLSIRAIPTTAPSVPLEPRRPPPTLDALPVHRVTTAKKHSPRLLSHYFSGLKEYDPLKSFVGFYNVLEYYFEEAPLLLKRPAKTELEQLHCVLDLLICAAEIQAYLAKASPQALQVLCADIQTSSQVPIAGLVANAASASTAELGRWLYDIRCAIVHSKKTRKGKSVASFEPYSTQARNVMVVLPILKWLAIACIEKDYALRAGSSVT
jgi:hypothetical protein